MRERALSVPARRLSTNRPSETSPDIGIPNRRVGEYRITSSTSGSTLKTCRMVWATLSRVQSQWEAEGRYAAIAAEITAEQIPRLDPSLYYYFCARVVEERERMLMVRARTLHSPPDIPRIARDNVIARWKQRKKWWSPHWDERVPGAMWEHEVEPTVPAADPKAALPYEGYESRISKREWRRSGSIEYFRSAAEPAPPPATEGVRSPAAAPCPPPAGEVRSPTEPPTPPLATDEVRTHPEAPSPPPATEGVGLPSEPSPSPARSKKRSSIAPDASTQEAEEEPTQRRSERVAKRHKSAEPASSASR